MAKSSKKNKQTKSSYDPTAPRGRKEKYIDWITPDGLTILEGYARNGLTDDEISLKIGINRTTLYDWKKRFPTIANVLKTNKESADLKVEQALYKLATGYAYDYVNADGKKVTQEVQPNLGATIFWLKNRQPQRFRDKQEVAQEVTIQPSAANDAILDALGNRKVEE